jgi:hypothetical protein
MRHGMPKTLYTLMKVKITYEECLYFKLEKEVEMTEQEYKEYLKNGASIELQHELSSECCVDHFQEGETIAINFQKI